METLIINIPEKKSILVKQLLKELGVTFSKKDNKSPNVPNEVTMKAIKDAHNGVGVGEPIKNINSYIDSL